METRHLNGTQCHLPASLQSKGQKFNSPIIGASGNPNKAVLCVHGNMTFLLQKVSFFFSVRYGDVTVTLELQMQLNKDCIKTVTEKWKCSQTSSYIYFPPLVTGYKDTALDFIRHHRERFRTAQPLFITSLLQIYQSINLSANQSEDAEC